MPQGHVEVCIERPIYYVPFTVRKPRREHYLRSIALERHQLPRADVKPLEWPIFGGRAALLHPRRTRASLPCCIAPPPVCTCATAALHCTALGVHVRTCRAALHHLRCTRAPLPRCIAPPSVCTCAPAALHCTTPGVHVRHLPRCTAPPLVCTCATAALHCATPGVHVRTFLVAALRHQLSPTYA